ncbi:MAG: LacI family DNA-binding transcriptional regulator [Solirubrobacteraceae bacterium]
MRQAVTIKDVARLAEVHPATVSRALNPETRFLVTDETAIRVIAAAQELGYQANPMARGLKTKRSYTVGVLIPDITNPLFPPILRGIEDRLDEAGYTTLIVNTDNQPEREQQALATMSARQVDGFIAATARLDAGALTDPAASGVPVVLVNRGLEDASLPMVGVDDRAGARLAVEHLADLGHSLIGHVAGPQATSTGHQRCIGYFETLRALGLPVDERRVSFAGAFTESEGMRACAELLGRNATVTALFAGNDLLALGCYEQFAKLGLRCPEDLSLVGFNDIALIGRLQPPLTTVRMPARDVGAAAADLLLQCLVEPTKEPCQIFLAPSLVVRGSTGPPPPAPPLSRPR